MAGLKRSYTLLVALQAALAAKEVGASDKSMLYMDIVSRSELYPSSLSAASQNVQILSNSNKL
jgi:hypothetical protein